MDSVAVQWRLKQKSYGKIMEPYKLQKTGNQLHITMDTDEDIEKMEKFIKYLIPLFYEIEIKAQTLNDETIKQHLANYEKMLNLKMEEKENEYRHGIKQKENEIKYYEEENNRKLQRKQEEIKQLHEKIIVLENEFHKEREQIKENIETMYKTETELRMELEISKKEREMELLESEKNKEIELLKQKIEHIHALDNYLEKNYNQSVELHDTIKHHFEEKQLSTSERGKIGEQYIMSELQKLTMFETDALIENVSGKSESGDIFLKLKELQCCIEVKNHTIDIRQTQIDKFQRDIYYGRYNCGIFISLYTPIVKNANINNFEIKVINKKPCIYLVNFHQNPENLFLAIKTLLFLLQNNRIVQNDIQYFIEKLNKTIENYNKLQENCNLIEKSVKNSKTIIHHELQEIYKLLKIEEKQEYKCDKCSKVYKTMKSLEKHKHEKHLSVP